MITAALGHASGIVMCSLHPTLWRLIQGKHKERQRYLCHPEERRTAFVSNRTWELLSTETVGVQLCQKLEPSVPHLPSQPGYQSFSCMSLAPNKGAGAYFPPPGCSCAGEEVAVPSRPPASVHRVPLANTLRLLRSLSQIGQILIYWERGRKENSP